MPLLRSLLVSAAALVAAGSLAAAPASQPPGSASPPGLALPKPTAPSGLPGQSSLPDLRAAVPTIPPAAAEAESEMGSSPPPTDTARHPDTAPMSAASITRATARLKELVARQDALLTRATKPNADMDDIQQKLQTLVFDYDDYLRTYSKFAPGYVTYGMLLDRVGMRRASVAIMLKANRLDPDLPIVKNQIGNYLAEEGRPVEAANYYLAAIRLDPKEPFYHYQLGSLLDAARDAFLKSGQWTRPQLDHAMQEALKTASDLAPGNVILAYRYAESFYDVANPDWDQALKVWGALEHRVSPGLEKDTIRLHAANILIKQKKYAYARFLLNTITVPKLHEQKQKLLDELPSPPAK